MKPSAIILAALVWTLTPVAVANRCVSEASFAVEQCACTVKNRILAGWNPAKVLSAYYAPDGHATSTQVATVAAVLDGSAVCDPDLYFMYSHSDTVALGITQYKPALVVRSGDKEVRFYDRWFRQK